MIGVLVAICLLVISIDAAAITEDQESCQAAAEQVGVDFENFKYNVGHMIHSLTVEDVRFFFEKNFPVDNDIPTVNVNLTGPNVLPYAPSFPSKFKFPLGSSLDRILLNNDDINTFSERGRTTLEELAHAAHMLEMLYRTSEVYKNLGDIDVNAVCPCLVNEEANGIIEELKFIAEVAHLEIDNSKSFEEQGLVESDSCTENSKSGYVEQSSRMGRAMATLNRPYVGGGGGRPIPTLNRPYVGGREVASRRGRSILICPNVPELTNSDSWKIFEHDITQAFDFDGATKMATNVAVYFYCKIAMLSQ